MAAKFIILAAFAAAAQASGGGYSFSYGVNDPNTRDIKSQHERKVGNSVVGQYSVVESDGTKRTVDYESHPQTGFNAVVKKDPPYGVHPAPGAYNAGLNGYASAAGYAGLAAPIAPLAHGAIAAPLAHGALASPLVHGALTTPLTHGALGNPLAQGALANPLAYGGYAGAGPVGLAGRAYSYANYNRYPGHGNGYAGAGFGSGYAGNAAGWAGYAGNVAGYAGNVAGYAGNAGGWAGNVAGYAGYGAGYPGYGAGYGAPIAPLAHGAINPLVHGVAPLASTAAAAGNYGAEW